MLPTGQAQPEPLGGDLTVSALESWLYGYSSECLGSQWALGTILCSLRASLAGTVASHSFPTMTVTQVQRMVYFYFTQAFCRMFQKEFS